MTLTDNMKILLSILFTKITEVNLFVFVFMIFIYSLQFHLALV